MQEIFPQSITITPILKRKGSEERSDSKRRRVGEDEETVVINGDSEEEANPQKPTKCGQYDSMCCEFMTPSRGTCVLISEPFQRTRDRRWVEEDNGRGKYPD